MMENARESKRIFAAYPGNNDVPELARLCLDLLKRQQADWPQLRKGYEALDHASIREVSCPGFAVKLQWNPQRIVSGSAMIDPASIRARPCFLCRENLSEAQQAVLYREDYLVLCNPSPIFAKHYTIAHIRHRPQAIEAALGVLLMLMKDLSPQFSVFYNGPRCGASAPDHLHFQAAPDGVIPIEAEIRNGRNLVLRKHIGGVAVFEAVHMGRTVLILEGTDPDGVAAVFHRMMVLMRRIFHTEEEPMMNLLGAYRDQRWRVLIFPRRRHRPDVYNREGADQILISPGAVDMGGLVITPVEKDFRTVDAGLIQHIFQDVSADEERVAQIIAAL
jgi:hypothetical protein